MFSALQKMNHCIRTACGVSSTSFMGGEVPFLGLGQGNSSGPTCRVVVSSAPIINMVQADGWIWRNFSLGYLQHGLFVMPLSTTLIWYTLGMDRNMMEAI
jgi:hypothetical protein